MADGVKGNIVGQTADWNDGPTDNGLMKVDVRASVKHETGDFFHLRYKGRMSFAGDGIKNFGTENYLIPNNEFHLLALGHMYTKSEKICCAASSWYCFARRRFRNDWKQYRAADV